MFLRTDLDELLVWDRPPAVSIYLPTHPASREVRQDAIRLRNLLGTAAKRMAAAARRVPETAELLEPARRLVDDEEFWRRQERGLALFLAPGFARVHKLPIEVPETLAVGRQLRIRPLLSLVDPAGRFWLLSVTAGRTRLWQGSRWSFAEFTGVKLPQGIAAIEDETVYEPAHAAAPTGRPRRGPAGRAKAQVFGDAPDELRKTELIELLRRIAAAAEPAVKRRPAPVILAATPEIQGNFREVSGWKELLLEGILENPDAMAAEELHRRAWRLFAPLAEKGRAEALGRLHGLLAAGDGRAAVKPEEIVKAAHYGRVDQLFLDEGGAPLWGRFVAAEDRVLAHGSPDQEDDDLLDYAATMTLRQGGKIILAERAQLPPDAAAAGAAAILRY
jgi:Bacterial archaeo-eukaryotic release factor family 3